MDTTTAAHRLGGIIEDALDKIDDETENRQLILEDLIRELDAWRLELLGLVARV